MIIYIIGGLLTIIIIYFMNTTDFQSEKECEKLREKSCMETTIIDVKPDNDEKYSKYIVEFIDYDGKK